MSDFSLPGGIWAITTYFNPIGYTNRLQNYHRFRSHFSLPLVTVELSFDGKFHLEEGDADRLIQIHGRDVMWQKERLLNLALKEVPADCDAVVWVDCDVIIQPDDWAKQLLRSLQNHSLVHLFRTRYDIDREALKGKPSSKEADSRGESIVHKIATGEASTEDFSSAQAWVTRGATLGLGWAARKAVLDQHGFYDACILGGADRVMLCAAYGKFDSAIRSASMNDASQRHFLEWARPFYVSVQGKVGYIPTEIFHLRHGSPENRRYSQRYNMLEDFNPYEDISMAPTGCWQWNSNKTQFHRQVVDYFKSRREDDPSS